VIASARSGKLCVLDLRLDQIDGASGCLHSCMHCGEAQVIPWKLVHRMLYCSAVQSSVDEFRSQDFGLKLNWEAPMGSDLCILFCLQNGTLIRPASTRFVIDCSRTPVPRNRFVQVGVYGGGWIYEAGSGHEDSSNVGCLAGFV
jgi:hypothetical protein